MVIHTEFSKCYINVKSHLRNVILLAKFKYMYMQEITMSCFSILILLMNQKVFFKYIFVHASVKIIIENPVVFFTKNHKSKISHKL